VLDVAHLVDRYAREVRWHVPGQEC